MLNMQSTSIVEDSLVEVDRKDWKIPEQETLFFAQTMTLLQPVGHPEVPQSVDNFAAKEQQQIALTRKHESHITILGYDFGKVLLKKLAEIDPTDHVQRGKLMARLRGAIETADFSYTFLPYFYKMQRQYNTPTPYTEIGEERTTIIQMVEVRGIENFFAQVNEIFGTDLVPPPTHITLFSHSTNPRNMNTGIGIASTRDYYCWVQESIPPWYPERTTSA